MIILLYLISVFSLIQRHLKLLEMNISPSRSASLLIGILKCWQLCLHEPCMDLFHVLLFKCPLLAVLSQCMLYTHRLVLVVVTRSIRILVMNLSILLRSSIVDPLSSLIWNFYLRNRQIVANHPNVNEWVLLQNIIYM